MYALTILEVDEFKKTLKMNSFSCNKGNSKNCFLTYIHFQYLSNVWTLHVLIVRTSISFCRFPCFLFLFEINLTSGVPTNSCLK